MGKKSKTKDSTKKEQPDGPKFLPFASHSEALSALASLGVFDASCVPSFETSGLVDRTNAKLSKLNLLDMTGAIPTTPAAAYQSLTVAAFHALAFCKKDENAAFLIMRTKENTPSFLFSHHHSLVQSVGRVEADLRVATYPTPSGLLVYQGNQVFLPKGLAAVSQDLAATCLTETLEPGSTKLSCCHCGSGFIDIGKDAYVRIREFAVLDDDGFLHRSCAAAWAKAAW